MAPPGPVCPYRFGSSWFFNTFLISSFAGDGVKCYNFDVGVDF